MLKEGLWKYCHCILENNHGTVYYVVITVLKEDKYTMHSTLKQKVFGRLCLLAAPIIWGLSFVVLKNTLDSINPLWTMAIRFITGAVFMIPICIKKRKAFNRSHLAIGALLGVTLFAAYALQTYGLKLTTPGKNAFLTSVYCVIVPFIGSLFFGIRIDRYNIVAAFICITGVGFVSLQKDLTVSLGDGLTLCCGLFFALQILLLDRHVATMSIELLAAMQFAVAGILSLIAALLFETPPAALGSYALSGLAYLSIMCTIVTFLCQSYGQKYTPASETAVLLSLESLFGAISSALLYKERMTTQLITGFILIFSAIIISETKLRFLRRRSEQL